MKKQLGYILVVGLLLITSIASFLLGKQDKQQTTLPKTNTTTQTSSTTAATSEKEEGLEVSKIAVVNLDEGVSKNGQIVNYASQVSRYPSDEFFSTSLEDAKRGLLTGDYGAYVIIPATFSENVESLNTKIQKSQIMYAVSNQLKDFVKVDVKDDINEYTKQLNQSISYLYVDSILNEFQETQGTISSVLLNNDKGNEALAMVEPADLLNFMDIPELKQPDAFVEAIDIEEEISNNSSLLESMINEYQTSLVSGQEGADQIVANGNTLADNTSSIFTDIGNRKIGYANNGDFLYKDEVSNISNNLKGYLDTTETWVNGISTVVNDATPDINAPLNSANHYYQPDSITGVSPYDNQVNDLVNYYGSLNIEPVISGLSYQGPRAVLGPAGIEIYDVDGTGVKALAYTQIIDSAGVTINTVDLNEFIDFINMDVENLVRVDPATPPGITITDPATGALVSLTDPTPITNYLPAYAPFEYVEDPVTGDMNHDPSTLGVDRLNTGMTAASTLDSISIASADPSNPLTETNRNAEIDNVKNGLEKNVASKIKDETNTLNDDLRTQSSNLKTQTNDYNQTINNYDPFSYLDQPALQGRFTSMQDNNVSIQGRSSEHIGKMGENMLSTFTLYGENQIALLDSVQGATEKGTEKVTTGLFTAKEALDELMGENFTLLQPITTKLAYAKTGDVADRSVYQYIVSPITISNQSDDNRVTPAERRTKDNDQQVVAQTLTEKKSSGNNLIIPFIGGFLLLILVALGIYTGTKKKRNTQNW